MSKSTAPEVGDSRLPDRFWAKVSVQPNGCWLWTGARYWDGYGQYWNGERNIAAHREAHAALAAPIAAGMQLDHLCHTNDRSCPGGVECAHRGCVNPSHTEQVSQTENNSRGGSFSAANANKTHCPRSHAYTHDNTRVRADGRRECLTCERDRDRRRSARKSSAATQKAGAR